MIKAEYCRSDLLFKEPATTSRETMNSKCTYYIKVYDDQTPGQFGLGECALFRGLSCDDRSDYETRLREACRDIEKYAGGDTADLADYPSLRFGVETAVNDYRNGGVRTVFPGAWRSGEKALTINGLVWMGNREEMFTRLQRKLEEGFRCVKFKIGGIDFEDELSLIAGVRERFTPKMLEIRLDANGAFSPANAMSRLERLAAFVIHSIEQPIRAGQWTEMARLCKESPVDIALDEELIGINDLRDKKLMLSTVAPQYIILKPALCGGFSGGREWIDAADRLGIGWWITSALESNIGLNAIAQWADSLSVSMPQGLGTGELFTNNIPSPVTRKGQLITYDPTAEWEIPDFQWKR